MKSASCRPVGYSQSPGIQYLFKIYENYTVSHTYNQ